MKTVRGLWCSSILASMTIGFVAAVGALAEDHILAVPATGIDRADKSYQGLMLFSGSWGDGPGQFGKVDEASRPGPMDFAVSGDRIFILDPVNSRVQVFDVGGVHQQSINIGTRTADFLAVDPSGGVVVMDAFVKRELVRFSSTGSRIGRVSLPSELTMPSGIFVNQDELWVEQRHDQAVRLSLPVREGNGGSAKVLGVSSGRLLADGDGRVHASKRGEFDVVLRAGEETTKQQAAMLKFPRKVTSIEALESDSVGRVYLAVSCQRPNRSPWETDLVVVVVDSLKGLVGTVAMPNQYITDHYRKIVVGPDGRIIQMQTSEEGVSFVSWSVSENGGEAS